MTIYGLDLLGAVKFEQAALKAFQPGDALGIFLTTFGDAKGTCEKLAKKKPSDFVIHLAPFDYSHKYPIASNMKYIKEGAAFVQKLALANPDVEFLISPFCEHNHPAKVMQPIFSQIHDIAPNCLLLNSIWKGEQVPFTITEIHLPDKKLVKKPRGVYTVAFDGYGGGGKGDFCDSDIQSILSFYSDARHIRGWDFEFNGKSSHLDETALKDRKEFPNVEYIKSRRAVMKVREGSVTWKAPNLYKCAADDHPGDSAGKDNRAMCVLQVRKDYVQVYDSKGKIIDVMKRTTLGDLVGKTITGARYYSKKYAYQLGDLAYANTGSRLIKIDKMPLTDADLRSNNFA
jgi:hypothetical protein